MDNPRQPVFPVAAQLAQDRRGANTDAGSKVLRRDPRHNALVAGPAEG
jgi:hypothetical protein